MYANAVNAVKCVRDRTVSRESTQMNGAWLGMKKRCCFRQTVGCHLEVCWHEIAVNRKLLFIENDILFSCLGLTYVPLVMPQGRGIMVGQVGAPNKKLVWCHARANWRYGRRTEVVEYADDASMSEAAAWTRASIKPAPRPPHHPQSSQLASTVGIMGKFIPLFLVRTQANVAGNAALTMVFKPFFASYKRNGRDCVIWNWTINLDHLDWDKCQRKQISFLVFFHYIIVLTVRHHA